MVTIQDIRREIRRAIAPFLPLLPPGSGASGGGDVTGPGSSTASSVPIFADATGKVLADATGLTISGGVMSYTGDFVLLDTKKLYLGADLDTYIYAGADDLPIFVVDDNPIMGLDNASLYMAGALRLVAQELQFDTDGDTLAVSLSDDNLAWKFGGTYRMLWTEGVIAGYPGPDPPALTFQGAAGDGAPSDGGDLILQSGLEVGAGEQGTVRIQDADGNDILTISDKGISGAIFHAGVVFDGGGAVIPAGQEVTLRVQNGMNISSWWLMADQVGSIQIDIWKDTWVNYPPDNADSITGSNPVEVSGDDQGSDGALDGWITTVNPGDVLTFHVDSCDVITRCTLILVGLNTGSVAI